MKIKAIHEIIYFDESRKTISPGATVDLADEVLKHIPDYAYTVVGGGDEGGDDASHDANGEPAKAVVLSKLNKTQLTEMAVGLGLTVDPAMTNANLVEAIKTAQTNQSNDDLV